MPIMIGTYSHCCVASSAQDSGRDDPLAHLALLTCMHTMVLRLITVTVIHVSISIYIMVNITAIILEKAERYY